MDRARGLSGRALPGEGPGRPHQMRLLPALRIYLPPKAIRITPPGPAGSPEAGNVEKAPREFQIDMLRCIFCGLCQEVCPEEAIFLMKDYSLTGQSRAEMVYDKEKLLALGGVHQDQIWKWKHK